MLSRILSKLKRPSRPSRPRKRQDKGDPPPSYESTVNLPIQDELERRHNHTAPREPLCLPYQRGSLLVKVRWDGSDWDGDLAALRASQDISTLQPLVYSDPQSPVTVAREAASFAIDNMRRGSANALAIGHTISRPPPAPPT